MRSPRWSATPAKPAAPSANPAGCASEPVTFKVAAERQLLERLTGAGVPAGEAELLITREWALLAGENERTTSTVQDLTGHPPRTVEAFLHENRELFR